MAADRDDYPARVSDIVAREAAARGDARLSCRGTDLLEVDCPFPQDSLLRLGYETERFRAYRELGRHLATRRLVPALAGRPDAGAPQPTPPLLDASAGGY